MTEKLNYDDAYVGEILVNKVNEIIDRLDTIEEKVADRFNANWKYQRIKKEELDKRFQAIERKLGIKYEEEGNGRDTERKERKDSEKGKQRAKTDEGRDGGVVDADHPKEG